MSSAQRQPKVFKDLGKNENCQDNIHQRKCEIMKIDNIKTRYRLANVYVYFASSIVIKQINSKNIIRGKCYVGQNRGRQKSPLTFSNKQGVRDVQNQIEIQCKDCNKTLLAEISVEKGCCFQKCEILSPSGFTIASARKRLHWLSYRLEFQDVYYILKTRSQCPLLIDVLNIQDRSVVAKLSEVLNSSLSSNKLTIKLVYQTELNLSKKIVILLMTGALNMTFKNRKYSINRMCSLCKQYTPVAIEFLCAFCMPMVVLIVVLVVKELM